MNLRKIYFSIVVLGIISLTLFGFLAQPPSNDAPKENPIIITTERNGVVVPVQPVYVPTTSTLTMVQEKNFGLSTKGRNIQGYEIGSGEETLLFFSALHGDEKNTADLLNTFVETVKQDTSLLHESKKLVVIPVANPDGYYEPLENLNANEVNLNRNFGTNGWKRYPAKGVFAGTKPFSEAESRVMQNVIQTYKPGLVIAFHSQGGLVSPEENGASIDLAKWYVSKTGYSYFDEWNYPGTATGWFADTAQRPAITVELSNHEQSDWEKNRGALLALISSAGFPIQ